MKDNTRTQESNAPANSEPEVALEGALDALFRDLEDRPPDTRVEQPWRRAMQRFQQRPDLDQIALAQRMQTNGQ